MYYTLFVSTPPSEVVCSFVHGKVNKVIIITYIIWLIYGRMALPQRNFEIKLVISNFFEGQDKANRLLLPLGKVPSSKICIFIK